MTQFQRFYIAGVGAIVFFALLLLLTRTTLSNEPRPDAIDPIRWSMNRTSDGHEDSSRTTWKSTDWSHFAYVQYVTNLPYLCNSLMLFESLHRLGCKPDRVMMYPSQFSLEGNHTEARLLRKARDEYKVILNPIEVLRRKGHDRKLLRERVRFEERNTKTRNSNLGRELHKVPCFQPNGLSAGPSP